MKKYYFYYLLAISVIVLDRATKCFAQIKLQDPNGVFVIKSSFFDFLLQTSSNNKLAFSLPAPQWLIIIVVFGLIVWLSIYFKQTANKMPRMQSLALLTIIASAISNLFDRIYYNGVIDFLSIRIGTLHWSIFNLADTFIVVGLAIFFYYEVRTSKNSETSK